MKNYNLVYITADGRFFDSLADARRHHWRCVDNTQYRGLAYFDFIRRRNIITGVERLYSCR